MMGDLKGIGYAVSTVSVLFLGVVAWPKPSDPQWHAWAVVVGMVTSILGMVLRYVSHRKDRTDIRRAANDEPPKPG